MREYLTILKTMMLATLFVWVASVVVSSTSHSEEVIIGIDYEKPNFTKSNLHNSAINFWKMIGCEVSLQEKRPAEERNHTYEGKECSIYSATNALQEWKQSKEKSIDEDGSMSYANIKKFYYELKDYKIDWKKLEQEANNISDELNELEEGVFFKSDEEKKELEKLRKIIEEIKKDKEASNDEDYIKDQKDLEDLKNRLEDIKNKKKKDEDCQKLLDQIEELLKQPIPDDTKNKIEKLKQKIEKLNDKECSKKLEKLTKQLRDLILEELKKIFEQLKKNLDDSGDKIHILIGEDWFNRDKHKNIIEKVNYKFAGYTNSTNNPDKGVLTYNNKLFSVDGLNGKICLDDVITGKQELDEEQLIKWNKYCIEVNKIVEQNINNLNIYINNQHLECKPMPKSVNFEWFNYDKHTKNQPPKHTTRRNAYNEYKKYVDDIFNKDPKVQRSKLKTNCDNIMSLEKELLCCQTLDCIALEKYVLEIEADKTLLQLFKDNVRTKFNNVKKNNSSCNKLKNELEEYVKKEKSKKKKKEEAWKNIEELLQNEYICNLYNTNKLTKPCSGDSYSSCLRYMSLNTFEKNIVDKFITTICNACNQGIESKDLFYTGTRKDALTHNHMLATLEDEVLNKDKNSSCAKTCQRNTLLTPWYILIDLYGRKTAPTNNVYVHTLVKRDLCRNICD